MQKKGEGGIYAPTGWRVFIDESDVTNLGAKAAAQFVALADYVDDRLATIQSTFDAHTHAYNPGPSALAPTDGPLSPIGTLPTVAATKVKAT